ncbi:uncharacterized protein VTP21DRAFT_4521 [Calcarisporiella thermophila]|uniref:uncharacterized protein n=1 Tax=Calcarisporiella thermophila TaxID=911321 RepID=UPI00374460C6
MPEKAINTPYPVIDTDPHISRVVRYFRPSDYAAWGVGTAAFPALLYGMDQVNPTRAPRGLGTALKLATFFGAVGGFMFAYQRSSKRFWGWSENEREVQLDKEEMEQRLKEGKPLYGESHLSPYMQGVSSRTSKYSALKLHAVPWFNTTNHESHGVDTSKYQASEN